MSGTELSGGEQQMLAIGRALETNPENILFDEPSEGLSPVAVKRDVEICRELMNEELACLLVEPNIRCRLPFSSVRISCISLPTQFFREAGEFPQA